MVYIDKNLPSATEIVKVVQHFIDTHWGRNHTFQHLIYSRHFKKKIRPLLMDEQKNNGSAFGYCCYCMRELRTDRNVTLEHIVPNNITAGDWARDEARYRQVRNLQLHNMTVCVGGHVDASNVNTPITSLPHPHFISYHNLVASCNGSVFEQGGIVGQRCCNNSRGNVYVYPFYLDSSINTKMKYTPDGKLDFDDEEFEGEWFGSKCLNLSSDWLVHVRHFWYLLSRFEDYDDNDVREAELDKEKRQNIIDDVTPTTDSPGLWEPFVESEEAWLLLSEYSWFYQYYKSRYPIH